MDQLSKYGKNIWNTSAHPYKQLVSAEVKGLQQMCNLRFGAGVSKGAAAPLASAQVQGGSPGGVRGRAPSSPFFIDTVN